MTSDLRDRLRTLLGEVRAWYAALNRRDQRLLVFGGGGSALVLFLGLVVLPTAQQARRYRDLIRTRRAQLRQMLTWQAEVKEIQDHLQAMGQPGKDFSLQSQVAALANQLGIRIDSMRPGPTTATGPYKETSLEVRLTSVTMSRLTELLYRIEKTPGMPLRIKRIHIKPTFRDPKLLEVVFLVSVLQSS